MLGKFAITSWKTSAFYYLNFTNTLKAVDCVSLDINQLQQIKKSFISVYKSI